MSPTALEYHREDLTWYAFDEDAATTGWRRRLAVVGDDRAAALDAHDAPPPPAGSPSRTTRTTMPPELHPDLAPIAGLLGTWEGDGSGDYPTIEAFRYREQVTFGHVGKPFLAYAQRTWHPETRTPMHAETGYVRVVGERRLELVLAHPTGIAEIEEGTWEGGRAELVTTTVGRSATAKDVRGLRRVVTLEGDTLSYDLWMAYAHVPETHHLHAVLTRTA